MRYSKRRYSRNLVFELFKPEKMSKVRITVAKKHYLEALAALQDTGAMQIDPLDEKARGMLGNAENSTYKSIADYAQRFRALERQLVPKPPKGKISFSSIEDLEKEADLIDIDKKVSELSTSIEHIDARRKSLDGIARICSSLEWFGHDLAILNGRSLGSFVMSGKDLQEAENELKALHDKVYIMHDKNNTSAIATVRRGSEKDFSRAVSHLQKLYVDSVPELSGTPKEILASTAKEARKLSQDRAALEGRLNAISDAYFDRVSAIREGFDIELGKIEVLTRMGATGSAVVMEGWVPSEKLKKLGSLLERITDGMVLVETLHTKELPPTKMSNPVTFKLFEFFVRFYSLPKSDEIDPTVMFAIAFPIFFGFMVGDFGYGAVMLLGSLWLLNRLKHPKQHSRLPKKLTSFVHMIVSDNGLRILAKSIIPGSIIAMALGIVFNEYFGFQLPYTALFNVELGLPTLLVIAGWIGVFMVSFGYVLGILNKLAIGEKKEAFGKVGWLMAAWGFVIFGLNILHKAVLGPSNPMAVLSYVLLIAGIALIAFIEKIGSLMELPSLISHILSYTRLVGILLASVILAEVIDFIFLHAWHHSILLGLVGTLILIVGQLFNIVIAMFEPGIQGARLIYVEFFSKFYSGNGREFTPFASSRKRTVGKFSLDVEREGQVAPHRH
ncbi:MAG: V-type ATP synthase subunit I [Candidatus Micrarchaeaceae archaeon]